MIPLSQSPQHTADMGEMRNSGITSGPSQQQFDRRIDNNEPLGFERDGRDKQHDDRIGPHHTESQQQSHYGARCSQQLNAELARQPRHSHLHQRGPHAADHVVNQKALRAERVFQRTAEHPQCEHIEKQMFQAGMKKHVGDELVGVVIGAPEPVEHAVLSHKLIERGDEPDSQKREAVDDYQVLHHRRRREITAVHCLLLFYGHRTHPPTSPIHSQR